MANGERIAHKQHRAKNRKNMNQIPEVRKIASYGISHNPPKIRQNQSEPGNANVNRDNEMPPALQPAPIKKNQQQEKEGKGYMFSATQL